MKSEIVRLKWEMAMSSTGVGPRSQEPFRVNRRSFLSHGAATMLMASMPAYAGANSGYPDRPIQIFVPFAAGSASDVITRILLGRMATSLGQNFVVENRPGAGGNTGTAAAAHAAPSTTRSAVRRTSHHARRTSQPARRTVTLTASSR